MLLRGFRFLHLISVSCSLMGGGTGMVVASVCKIGPQRALHLVAGIKKTAHAQKSPQGGPHFLGFLRGPSGGGGAFLKAGIFFSFKDEA